MMKVIKVLCVALIASSCNAVAIQPSTFGGVVDSFGRLSNTIKDTSAWKRFNDMQLQGSRSLIFPRAMNAVQDLVRGIRQEERVVINTRNGMLRGRYLPYKTGIAGGYYSFQGIKYGKAPVGNRRFKAPLPEASWKGVRPAVREGASCPHRNMILENFKGNEDCLFLNVYTPKLPDSQTNPKLPVLFWIHGGGFQFGNGNAFLYGPDYLLPENIILVTINYRLGALGFLNTGTDDAPGNAGLKDQVLALRWVQENIDKFGGDPNAVTISGQSAGSASVHYLLMSPLTKGLFKRAIAQSGVALNPWAITDIPHQRAVLLGKALNFQSNNTEKLVQFLRKVKPQMIVDASPKTLTEDDSRKNIGLAFVPSVETALERTSDWVEDYDLPFLTEEPTKLLKEGRFNQVPLMLGFNSHEAMLFLRRLKKDKTLLQKYENDFARLIPTDLNITQGRYSSESGLVADRIRDFYLGGRPITEDTVEEMIFLLTDEMFVRGLTSAAKVHAKFATNSTFMYRFAYDGALGLYKRLLNVNRPGVCHGDELGYLFYFGIFNVNLDPSSSETNTKKRMVKMWTNFVKYGDPTPMGKDDQTLAVQWDPIKSTAPYQIPYLDITKKLELKMNPEPERMEFWDDLYEQYNGSVEGQSALKLSPEDAKDLTSMVTLLWGNTAAAEYLQVFVRWSQGFVFSADEQSALVQNAGGPCSVIATVQAYVLKFLINELPATHQFKDLTEEKCKKILIKAICNMLMNSKEQPTFRIVLLDKPNDVEKALEASEETESRENHEAEQMETSMNHDVCEEQGEPSSSSSEGEDLSPERFHERLVIQDLETIEEVEKFYSENFSILSKRFGVLLHLYSVLFTKGIENVLSEISDTSEPLIHSAFGYGSQALINLMLTGRGVQHVFDNETDIGGLKLIGIDRQSEIGFITLMEQLRYCTVGSFYKNPKHPIWVMGSETHLTVLFSNEKSLVSPETPAEHARRVFAQYDTENSSFISSAVLQDVMVALGLESDVDYVEIMRRKLDPDSTSIVLLSDFMYEFFPEDKKSTPDTFDLFHYNGIPNSNDDHKVRYSQGKAILLESHIADMCSRSDPMLTCLQTKWPNIEINWNQHRVPSLN